MRSLRIILAGLVGIFGLSGCIQLDTHVKLHRDGSVTVTERLQLSKALLEFEQTQQGQKISGYLQKEAALARAKQFGNTVTLTSHEIRDLNGGARESIAVYTAPEIQNLRYASPFFNTDKYAERESIRFHLTPIYALTVTGRNPGDLQLSWSITGKRPSRKAEDEGAGPTPSQVQKYRQLKPVFKDMLKGLKMRLKVEVYAPIHMRSYYRFRGQIARTKSYNLIDFSADDLDSYGSKFLDNEEIMLELLQGQFGGNDVVRHTKGQATNLTLPVFHVRGGAPMWFRPSKFHFDKYFKGKTLDWLKHGGKKPAKFEPLKD